MDAQRVDALLLPNPEQVEPHQINREKVGVAVGEAHTALPPPRLVLGTLGPVKRHTYEEQLTVGDRPDASERSSLPCPHSLLRAFAGPTASVAAHAAQMLSAALLDARRHRQIPEPQAKRAFRHAQFGS